MSCEDWRPGAMAFTDWRVVYDNANHLRRKFERFGDAFVVISLS